MRILHTSDWHLGRLFHGASLLDEQRAMVDRVVELAAEHRVDAVIIAGDLFDRAIPPSEAVTLFGDALVRLRAVSPCVVALAGNHDSPHRVGVYDPILRAGGVTLRGHFQPDAPVVLEGTDGGPPVVIHPIPFLEPLVHADQIRAAAPGEAADEAPRPRLGQNDVLCWAMDLVRADLASRGPVRSVVAAHSFVAGGVPCNSEREISIGDVDRVPTTVFDGINYVAMGHLHGQQEVAGPRVAYSGSPLPYSFSEEHQNKGVRIVELAVDGSVNVTHVPLGVGRGVRTITGSLQELLDDSHLAAAEQSWVRVCLTDPVLPRRAMDRLRERFAFAVVLEVRPSGGSAAGEVPQSLHERVAERTDLDLAVEFLTEQFDRPPTPAEQALLAQAAGAVRAASQELIPS